MLWGILWRVLAPKFSDWRCSSLSFTEIYEVEKWGGIICRVKQRHGRFGISPSLRQWSTFWIFGDYPVSIVKKSSFKFQHLLYSNGLVVSSCWKKDPPNTSRIKKKMRNSLMSADLQCHQSWFQTRWLFQIFFHFHPYLGKWSILTNINMTNMFKMVWNHQLANSFPCLPWKLRRWFNLTSAYVSNGQVKIKRQLEYTCVFILYIYIYT